MPSKPNSKLPEISITKYADGWSGPDTTDDKELYKAFGLLHQAKTLEEKAKQLREQANPIFESYFFATGASGLSLGGIGGANVYQGSQTRTDYDAMHETLILEYGVPAEHIMAAKTAATKTKVNDKTTVKFSPEKGE